MTVECFKDSEHHSDMLITTHAPFLISDSKPDKVLVFNKSEEGVHVSRPDYNTFGASINKITVNTFGKVETIGGVAKSMLDGFRARMDGVAEVDLHLLLREVHKMGDSVEKVLLVNSILDCIEKRQG